MSEAPTHEKSSFSIDSRTIAMAVLFLAGGVGGGGGISMIGNDGVKEQIDKLSVKVDQLADSVNRLAVQASGDDRDHESFRLMLADHEIRIRKLEGAKR